MSKVNWQDPASTEIRSPHISGLQEAVGKIEDAIQMKTKVLTGVALSEVYISGTDRYRIYQAPAGSRNWALSPAPVIKKNAAVISIGFEIDYGGGAVIFNPPILGTDAITADVTALDNGVGPLTLSGDPTQPLHAATKQYADAHTAAAAPHSGHETPTGAQAKVDAHAAAADPHPQYATDTALNTHQADNTAHGVSNKVNRGGDIMTGDLTAPNIHWGANRTINLAVGYNLNNLQESGWYDVQNPAGGLAAGWWRVEHFSHSLDGAWSTQIAYSFDSDGEIYIRRSWNAASVRTWGSWQRMWHAGNLTPGVGTKAYGNIILADTLTTGQVLTKDIALGANYLYGQLVMKSTIDGGGDAAGILATFGTNNLNTLVTGFAYRNNPQALFASAWSRRWLGYVCSAQNDYLGTAITWFGRGACGNGLIRVSDIYVVGSNLRINFYNPETTSQSLNCVIDWQVHN